MSELTEIRKAMEQFAEEVIYAARINLEAKRKIRGKSAQRVATGNLRDDLTYTFWKRGNMPILIFTTGKKATRDYADVIEMGRRADKAPPPVDAILKWMKVKKFKLREQAEGKRGQFKKSPKLKLKKVKGKDGKKRMRATSSAYNSAAYVISRSIGRRGIEGINYMRDAILPAMDEYDEIFGKALLAEIDVRLKSDKFIS